MVRRLSIPVLLLLVFALPSCTALNEIANLRNVDFDFGGTDDEYLAGIDLNRVRSYNDLRATDIARLGAAVATQELPLRFTLHLDATNPADNPANARLVQFDWTLFLDGTETVSGTYNQPRVITPGMTADIPVDIELDLVRFFGNNLRDLVELGLAVAGESSQSTEIRVALRPTIETPLGPMRYPGAINVSARVGGGATR